MTANDAAAISLDAKELHTLEEAASSWSLAGGICPARPLSCGFRRGFETEGPRSIAVLLSPNGLSSNGKRAPPTRLLISWRSGDAQMYRSELALECQPGAALMTQSSRKLELTGEATPVAENVAQQLTYASSRTHLLFLIPAVYLNLATDHSRLRPYGPGTYERAQGRSWWGKKAGPPRRRRRSSSSGSPGHPSDGGPWMTLRSGFHICLAQRRAAY